MICCAPKNSSKKFRIGFAQCTGSDLWRKQMLAAMHAELLFHPDIELEYRDAQNDTEKQRRDIEGFIDDKVDLLIVTPNEADAITPSVELAYKKGIPVVMVDRKINSEQYTAYIGADNYEIGKLAGALAAEISEGNGTILEVWGLRESSPALERHRGFSDAIAPYPNLKIVASLDGQWEQDTAAHRFRESASILPSFNIVYAHNDVMAYSVYTLCQKQGRADSIKFIGVDGLSGPGGGLQLVEDKILTATFLYPTGGEEAIRTASNILHGQPYIKDNILQTTPIDSRNVKVMQLQQMKMEEQRNDIVRLQQNVNSQGQRFDQQQLYIYILLASLAVMLWTSVIAIISWRKKRDAYQALAVRNEEILTINEQLKSTNNKLEDAHRKISEQTQTILRQKDEQLNRVLDSSNDIIWSIDLSRTGKNYLSRSARRLLGKQVKSEMMNDAYYWREHIPEDDWTLKEEALQAVLREGYAECTYRIKTSGENYHWLFEKIRIVYDEQERPLRQEGLIVDITNQKKAEEIILRYQQQLDIIFSNTQEMIALLDVDGRVLLFNKAFENFMEDASGVKPAIGKHIWDITVKERQETSQQLFQEALEGKFIKTTAAFHVKSGTVYHSLRYEPVLADGKTTHVAIIAFDITQQKEQEYIVRESEANLKAIFDNTRDSFTLVSPDYKIIAFNKSNYRNVLLRTNQELKTGVNLLDYISDDRKNAFVNLLERVENGEMISYDANLQNGGLEAAWFKTTISPVKSEEGKFIGYCIEAHDITEQKEFEGTLTAIARELSSLIENANVPIFGIDQHGKINEWNRVSFELTGFSRTEMIGRNWVSNLLEPEYHEVVTAIMKDALNGVPVSNFELPLLSKKKQKLSLLLSISPRRDAENKIVGATIVGQNITELIEYKQNLERMVYDRTRELNEALQKEKELVEMKSRFVSIASHEFRTPLSSISLASGFIKKYKQKITPEEVDKRLDNIEKQVGHMTHLLDDVLLIGKTEAGKLVVHVSQVDVFETFEKLKNEIEQSTGNTHTVKLHVNGVTGTISTDEKLIRTMVINVLTNAIKFSPGSGYVDLFVTAAPNKLTIRVKDNGIGIPEEDIKNLFEPFYRASNANDVEGTGLGLSIIRKALDLLRGYIDIKSTLGKGTEITIVIPLAHA